VETVVAGGDTAAGEDSTISTTVPFRIVRPSRVTGPVDVDEIGQLSRVTSKVAD
jgi:hypothetical protein